MSPKPRRHRQNRTALVLALLGSTLLGGLVFVAACGSQGEGERCQKANDNANGTNDDCDDGLVCKASKDLPLDPSFRGQVRDNEGRCCPFDPNRATVAECKRSPTVPGGDSGIPVEAGGDATPEAATDGATEPDAAETGTPDAEVDAAPDAPADANEAG